MVWRIGTRVWKNWLVVCKKVDHSCAKSCGTVYNRVRCGKSDVI